MHNRSRPRDRNRPLSDLTLASQPGKQAAWVLSLVLLAGGLLYAQDNLIQNPGFEDKATDQGLPAGGWWLYEAQGQPEVTLDRQAAHTGAASIRFRAEAGAKFVLVSPKFPVAPGDAVAFEAWVRGESARGFDNPANLCLAFRQEDGRIFARTFAHPASLATEWSRVSGSGTAPPEAISAEIHLGYTNAAGRIWYDDVRALITSPLSLVLVEDSKPWPGQQDLAVQVTSRKAAPFAGRIRARVAKKETSVPVALGPRASARVKVPVTLAGIGAHNYTLSLLDASGTVQRELTGRFRTTAPMVLFPACPCYHAVGQGDGSTRLDVRLNASPAQRRNARLAIELTDSSGKSLDTKTADASAGDIVGVTLDVPVKAPGDFVAKARLLDSAGSEIGAANTDIHVRPAEESRVTTGPDGFLRVAGKPQFPIGMYSCGQFEEMAAAGFGGTHNYGITTGEAAEPINPNDPHLKDLLDRSWRAGMRMMVELPRKAIEKAEWPQVRRRVQTFRHHPGLLCWGSEERVARGEAPLKNIAALYQLVHELDPNHPLVLGDTKDVIRNLQVDRRDFFPDACMDAGIWWWYPIPLRGTDTDGNVLEGSGKASGLLQPPSWLTTSLSKKPLWIAIQCYQHPRKDARFPTPTEYRCLAYLSLINGVKSLWFYTGYGQKDWQGKPAGLLNRPVDGHWEYVQKLVRELREFSPVIMAPVPANRPSLSPPEAPVDFTLRELGGKLYLIAANKSMGAQTVRFTGSQLSGKRAQVLYEDHAAAIRGEVLADSLGPLAVRVYRVEP